MGRGLIMSHYIILIYIYIYIYGQGPHHVPLYIDGVAMHGVARMSRMPIDVVEKVYGCRGGRASQSELSLPRKEQNK